MSIHEIAAIALMGRDAAARLPDEAEEPEARLMSLTH